LGRIVVAYEVPECEILAGGLNGHFELSRIAAPCNRAGVSAGGPACGPRWAVDGPLASLASIGSSVVNGVRGHRVPADARNIGSNIVASVRLISRARRAGFVRLFVLAPEMEQPLCPPSQVAFHPVESLIGLKHVITHHRVLVAVFVRDLV
jgi:hypothetical protein